MDAQETFSNLFKIKRDQYLVDIRKKKNGEQIIAKRLKLTSEAFENRQANSTSSSNVTEDQLKV